MSGYDAGALFVKIVPDASGFGTDAAREIKAQAPAVQQAAAQTTASRGASSEVAKLQAQARELTGSFAQAAKTADAQLFGGLQARSAALSEELARLTAQGGNVVAHLSGDFNAMFAAEAKAAAATQQVNAALAETVVLEEKVARSERSRGQAQAQTARSQLRNVLTGQAGLSSLGPAALGRFALGGLAVGAVFQGLQHLSDGLRVTGDEAATTEGKLRNFGASLVTGDIVGGLLALTVHADTASESLQKLLAKEGTSTVDLRNFANQTRDQAQAQQEFAEAADKAGGAAGRQGGRFAGVSEAARQAAADLRETASAATQLAAAFDAGVTAANDVAEAIRNAGSEAGAFGPERGGAGAIDRANARPGAGAAFTDETNTSDNANAIAQSIAARTKGLQDDLTQAQKEAAQAAATEQRLKSVVEGAAARHRATVEAQTKVDQIQNQIDAQAAAAAKAAAAERARSAREAQAARDAAQRAYEQSVANQVRSLQIAADAAGNIGKAEQRYIAVLKREANDARLSTQAQLGYAAALTNERQNQTKALQEAAAAEQARKLALDDLRIQQADLTDGTADNERAINRKIRDLKALRSRTKQYSDEWIAYSSQITGLQIQIQNLKDSARGNDFTLQDLFNTAADQFATFGSNIADRNGVLSGQDERAAFGETITNSVAARSLAQQEQQTAILRSMLAEMRTGARGGSPAVAGKGKTGNLQAIYGAEIAAAYGYGVN